MVIERGTDCSFGLIGPVVAWRKNRSIELGTPQQRMVLALLLLHRNHVVTTDRIVDVLWPAGPPRSARDVVRTYVSRLRGCLDGTGGRLVGHRSGYELRVTRDEVDADRFEGLITAGGAAREAGKVDVAATSLRNALALVRGEALVELADDELAGRERDRLAELRLIAEEELIEVELAQGRHRALVPRLAAAVAEQPLRERAWMQLMTALYRSGRQAEALDCYQRARRGLADELGLVPSSQFQELERMVLVHSSALDLPNVGRSGVPRYHTTFVGREADRALVERDVLPGRAVTIIGPAGAGKSRLAAEVAARFEGARKAPVWWVDLAPVSAGEVVGTAARAVAISDVPGQAPADLLLGYLSETPGLLVFDNCEHVLEPVAELISRILDRSSAVRILSTSREALRVGGEVLHPVLGLPVAEASRLLADRAGVMWSTLGERPDDRPAMVEVVRRLDGLPLAIELAAGKLLSLSIEELANGLRERLWLLGEGQRAAPARQRTLETAIGWSYELCSPDERSVLRFLAVFSAGFDATAATDVAGDICVGAGEVLPILTRLVERSLVVADRAGPTTRYRLLETVRAFAVARLQERGELDEAGRRHCAAFIAFAENLQRNMRDAALGEWLARGRQEHENVHAALHWALEHDDSDRAIQLASALGAYWWRSGHVAEGRELLDKALGIAEPTSGWWARGLVWRAWLILAAGSPGALEAARAAVAACERDGRTELSWLAAGSEAKALIAAGAFLEARSVVDRVARLAAADKSEEGIAYADQLRGILDRGVGDLDAAARRLIDARDRYRRLRKGADAGWVLVDLAHVRLAQERPAEASEAAAEAAADFRRRMDSRGLAGALVILGQAHAALGDHRRGRLALQEAAELASRWQHATEAEAARQALARLTVDPADV